MVKVRGTIQTLNVAACALLVSVLLGSCSKPVGVDAFVQIPDTGWEYSFQPQVELHVPRSDQSYRMAVNLRHTGQYKYSNLFVRIHRETPSGLRDTQRVELTLAKPDGRWTGRNSGNLFTHQVVIEEEMHFVDTGIYRFSIEQNMRDNPLQHVSAAGFRIEPSSRSGGQPDQ